MISYNQMLSHLLQLTLVLFVCMLPCNAGAITPANSTPVTYTAPTWNNQPLIKAYLYRMLATHNFTKDCWYRESSFFLSNFKHSVGNMLHLILPNSSHTTSNLEGECRQYIQLTLCGSTMNVSSKSCPTLSKTTIKQVVDLQSIFCLLVNINPYVTEREKTKNTSHCYVQKVNFQIPNDTLTMQKMKTQFTETVKIDKNISQKLEEDLISICHEFKVNENICQCALFQIQCENKVVDMCTVINGEKRSIRYSETKSDEGWIPEVIQKSCGYFNLSDAECKCKNLAVLFQNQPREMCKLEIEGPNVIESLDQLCDLFGIARNICSCQLFEFAREDPQFQTFCDFHDFLNTTVMVIVKYAESYVRPYAIVGTIASIVGVIGNGLVILVAWKRRKSLPRCKKLFAYLAASDFVFAVLQLIYLIPKFNSTEWQYGLLMCKMFQGIETLGSTVAIGTILIISIERYIGILEPFQRGMSKNVLIGTLILNSVIACIAVIPLFHYSTIDYAGTCRTNWPDVKIQGAIYETTKMFFYFLLPIMIITVLYTRIVFYLQSTVKLGSDNWIADPRLRRKRVVDNRRTMYMLWSVVIAFFFLVFPKHAVALYFNYSGLYYVSTDDLEKDVYFGLMYFALLPYPLHVAVNPIIYSLLDANWRKDVTHMLLFIPKRARAYSNTLSTNFNVRGRSISNVADKSPEDATRRNLHVRRPTIEMNLSPIPSPSNMPKIRHFSDSNGKLIESNYSFTTDIPDQFSP